MKRTNLWLIVAIVLICALPLWLTPLWLGEAADFAGADEKAGQVIQTLAPEYEPWFQPIFEPPSGEVASLLFALQAALGAGVIGYWLGVAVTRERLRREATTSGSDTPVTRAD